MSERVTGHSNSAAGRRARSGRRRGHPDTRATILTAARECFATYGFGAATIRGIAAEADVDPALVHHYFGSKRNLFLVTVQVELNPRAVVQSIVDGPVESIGNRFAAVILGLWESPAQANLVALVRSAISDPRMASQVRSFLFEQAIDHVLARAGCPDGELGVRGALLFSQMLGVILGRYILRLDPIAAQPLDTLVPEIGATLQRYLTGPLQGSAAVAE